MKSTREKVHTSFEINLLHPAAKEYLERSGFAYSYEVGAPKFGRCDFVIKPRQNFVVVADCKMNLSWHAVGQILGYKSQFEADEAWLIVPNVDFEDKYESHVFELCQKLQIVVVTISLSLAFDAEQKKSAMRIYHNQLNFTKNFFSVSKKEASEIRKEVLKIMNDRNYDDISTTFEDACEILKSQH